MDDLNDFLIFSRVVEHSGFTGAARALGVARSRICRHVGQLEDRLGIRLVQRSTRHFTVTDFGKEFHVHCVRMAEEARAAYEKAACARAKPSGLLRVSCPAAVAQLLVCPLIPLFVDKNPEVRIALEASSRRMGIEDNFDLSIRIGQSPSEDSGMIMRSLGIVRQALVASRGFLDRHGWPSSAEQAAALPSLGYGSGHGPHIWKFVDAGGKEIQLRHEPRLIADDMILVRQAAVAGVGIAQLPLSVCQDEVREGQLVIVLPELLAPLFEVQVVFPSRRGMLPAVRSFIDFLSAHCASDMERWQMRRDAEAGTRGKPRQGTKPKLVARFTTVARQGTEAAREARVG